MIVNKYERRHQKLNFTLIIFIFVVVVVIVTVVFKSSFIPYLEQSIIVDGVCDFKIPWHLSFKPIRKSSSPKRHSIIIIITFPKQWVCYGNGVKSVLESNFLSNFSSPLILKNYGIKFCRFLLWSVKMRIRCVYIHRSLGISSLFVSSFSFSLGIYYFAFFDLKLSVNCIVYSIVMWSNYWHSGDSGKVAASTTAAATVVAGIGFYSFFRVVYVCVSTVFVWLLFASSFSTVSFVHFFLLLLLLVLLLCLLLLLMCVLSKSQYRVKYRIV